MGKSTHGTISANEYFSRCLLAKSLDKSLAPGKLRIVENTSKCQKLMRKVASPPQHDPFDWKTRGSQQAAITSAHLLCFYPVFCWYGCGSFPARDSSQIPIWIWVACYLLQITLLLPVCFIFFPLWYWKIHQTVLYDLRAWVYQGPHCLLWLAASLQYLRQRFSTSASTWLFQLEIPGIRPGTCCMQLSDAPGPYWTQILEKWLEFVIMRS